MKRLFSYLLPYRISFLTACGSSILNKVLDLMPPVLVGWVIDSVSHRPPSWIASMVGSSDPWKLAVFLAFLGVAIFALESFFQWGYQYGFMVLAQKLQHRLRMDTYQQMQSREIEFFENQRLGETMAVLNDDVNQLERFLNNGFNELLQLVVLFIFAGVTMFSTSWQLALFGIIPIPIVLWGSLFYQKMISPRYQKLRERVGALSSRLENNIAGILVIKSFTAEKFEQQRVEEASKAYQEANFQAIRYSALYVPLIRMAVAFGFGGVLLMGSYWVLDGKGILTVGELVFFSMIIQRLLWPLTRLGVTLDDLERARASTQRIFFLLDTPSKIQDPPQPKKFLHLKGQIQLENLFFCYQNQIPILGPLNFTLEAGTTIGLAGTTGAGKSTLIKLLLRLYDPVSGRILIDGTDIRHVRIEELRQQIALVSQDVYLFHGTIEENIAYGSTAAHFYEVEQASRLAQLDEFVTSLPQGYQTIVGERGIKLSGGQRQRLSIARAILKNAPIMIFDEATSSVDTETERAIQENLRTLTAGKTALIIAHRLSTIRNADRILVLGKGSIVEEGHHDDLIKKNGIYADLWRVQSGDAHNY